MKAAFAGLVLVDLLSRILGLTINGGVSVSLGEDASKVVIQQLTQTPDKLDKPYDDWVRVLYSRTFQDRFGRAPDAHELDQVVSDYGVFHQKLRSKSLSPEEKAEVKSLCQPSPEEKVPHTYTLPVWPPRTPFDQQFNNRTLNAFSASTIPGLCHEMWDIIFEHGTLHPEVSSSQEAVRIGFILSCLLLHAMAVAACCVRTKQTFTLSQAEETPDQQSEPVFEEPPDYVWGLKAFSVSMLAMYYTCTPFSLLIPSPYSEFNAPGKMLVLGRGLTWTGVTICLSGYEVGYWLRKLDTCTWDRAKSFYRTYLWKMWPYYHIAWCYNVYTDLTRVGIVSVAIQMGMGWIMAIFLFLNFIPFSWVSTFNIGQSWASLPNDSVFGKPWNWTLDADLMMEFWANPYMICPQMFVLQMIICCWFISPLLHNLFRRCQKGPISMHLPLLVAYYWGAAATTIGYFSYLWYGEYIRHAWDIYQINPILRLGEFALGMSTAYVCQAHKAHGVEMFPNWFGDACFAMLVLCIGFVPEASHSQNEFGPFLIFGGLSFLVCGCLYGNEMKTTSGGLVPIIFGNRVLKACGKRSYVAQLFFNPVASLCVALLYGQVMVYDEYPSMDWRHMPLLLLAMWLTCVGTGSLVDHVRVLATKNV